MKELKKIFLAALQIRFVEEKISLEYKNNKMRCPTHLSIGQEFIAAAVGYYASKKDFFISYHRSHAHYLAKGGSVQKLIDELHGLKSGCSKGFGGSMHLIDLKKNFIGSTAIVSSAIPIGVGFANAIKLSKKKNFVFIFIGDASIEEGVFYESINYTILKKLPVIFICENNAYSVYTHISRRQPKNRKIKDLIAGLGMKYFGGSQSRPVELIRILDKAIKYSKSKKLPSFLEVQNFRHLEHCGPNFDDHLNYRSKKMQQFWKKNDSLEIIKNQLKNFSFVKEKSNLLKKIDFAFLKAKRTIENKVNIKDYVYKK